jgi:hypothetical protein
MTQPGSIVNGFSRDGRALIVMGVQGGSGARQETLKVLAPEKLGLKEGVRYRVVDLRHNRHLSDRAYSARDLAALPVTLTKDDPKILLVEPERKGPRVVFFKGADEVTSAASAGWLEFKVKAVPGSPLELHVDTAGQAYRPQTPGFTSKEADGEFAIFAGQAPADGVVKLARSEAR